MLPRQGAAIAKLRLRKACPETMSRRPDNAKKAIGDARATRDRGWKMDLDTIHVERYGRSTSFNGTWYRGEHTHFIPCKEDLRRATAFDEFVMTGWAPPAPFIDRTTSITSVRQLLCRQHLRTSGGAGLCDTRQGARSQRAHRSIRRRHRQHVCDPSAVRMGADRKGVPSEPVDHGRQGSGVEGRRDP